jgi:hypothetical protein
MRPNRAYFFYFSFFLELDKHTNVQTFLLEACPMKKIFGFLLAILILYVIYIDLTVGTLPASLTQQVDAKIETEIKQKVDIPSFEAKVEPGETVISIVEHQINKSLPVSINELIEDFRKLNPGETPEKIQIGSTYHFPDYSK